MNLAIAFHQRISKYLMSILTNSKHSCEVVAGNIISIIVRSKWKHCHAKWYFYFLSRNFLLVYRPVLTWGNLLRLCDLPNHKERIWHSIKAPWVLPALLSLSSSLHTHSYPQLSYSKLYLIQCFKSPVREPLNSCNFLSFWGVVPGS